MGDSGHFPGLTLPVILCLSAPATPGMVSGVTPWANIATNPHCVMDQAYTPGCH